MSSWAILESPWLVGYIFLTSWGYVNLNLAGRVGHQKRIRKLIRMLSFSAGIHIVVWEECYWRWRALNEIINNMSSQGSTSLESADPNHSLAQQARFLKFRPSMI
jgi:hypothetical protein